MNLSLLKAPIFTEILVRFGINKALAHGIYKLGERGSLDNQDADVKASVGITRYALYKPKVY